MATDPPLWERMSLDEARQWLRDNFGLARNSVDINRGLKLIGAPEPRIGYEINVLGYQWLEVWVKHPEGVVSISTRPR